jgi:hypothetical protein
MAANDRRLSSWYSFSRPTASATSYMPEATYSQAMWNAVEELAQAFSVLIIGMPPIPISRRTTWPRMHSWPVISPAAALPTTAASSFDLSMPAEPRAPSTASRVRSFMLRSRNFPNFVMPAPIIATSAWRPP